MRRCIWLVFGVMLAMSLAGCAQQEATEVANEEVPALQEKTADDYVNEGTFSTDCPVSGSTAGAVWYDSGYQVKTMDGTLVENDALVVEAGLTVKASSPSTEWGIGFCVALLDGDGSYLCSYGGWKNGPTGSREASVVCENFSQLAEKYGIPQRYELYVVRCYVGEGNWWGFTDEGQLFVTATEPVGYEAVKKAGKLIGEGSVQRSGDASGNVGGNVSSGSSSVERYRQSDSDNSAPADEQQLKLYRAQDDVVYTLSVGASEWNIGSQVMSGNGGGGLVLRGTVENGLLVAETGAVYQMDSLAGGAKVVCVDKADGTVAFMEGDYSEDKGKADEAALNYVR